MPGNALTAQQQQALNRLRPGEPMAWLLVYPSGFTAVLNQDRAHAEVMAAKQHAVLIALEVGRLSGLSPPHQLPTSAD